MALHRSLQSWDVKKIEDFFSASASFRSGTTPYLVVAAVKGSDELAIISARVVFASPTANVMEREFTSKTLRVFLARLPDVETAERIIWSAASGSFVFGGETYRLWNSDGGGSIAVERFNETMGPQLRLCALLIRGRDAARVFDPQDLDWELRAADPPYLGLGELLSEFGVPTVGSHTAFEAYHTTPIAIDRERSTLTGTELAVSVRVEPGLSISDAQVALVGLKLGEAPFRKTYAASDLTWTADGNIQLGTIRCSVPRGRSVQAVAIFRGVAFHYWWIVDPLQIPNTRKAVYQVTDTDLATLREFMVGSGPKGSARDLESAVAWLLWMLGFSVAHLGANTRTQDAVDILAATPNGNFALVECTTGVISTDKKVANLLSRKAVVLERLARASHNSVRVLAVVVTSKGRDEVLQEIKPTEERGVLVITRDDLLDLLNRTDILPDADELFNNAEVRLAPAEQGSLPGIGTD